MSFFDQDRNIIGKMLLKILFNNVFQHCNPYYVCLKIPQNHPIIVKKYKDQKRWYQFSKLHRDGDKPAVEFIDGIRYWYMYGKIHRDDDKSAIEFSDGTQICYQYGKLCLRHHKLLFPTWM